MNDATATLDPKLYDRWRATSLGALIETLDSRVVFELADPLAGVARLMARIDPVLARLGTFGAAFLCVVARKR